VLDVSVENGAKHFVLLSAICVQKPLLTFQLAKLKLEQDLAATESISHSIVRPTAFFKSLAGQVESVQKGGPYVMFGDGQVRPPGVSQIQRLFTAPFVTVRVYRE
jgi:divinyl chlorophyllide a 8-vinyl-reductase